MVKFVLHIPAARCNVCRIRTQVACERCATHTLSANQIPPYVSITLPHLAGSFVGKRNCHNIPRIDTLLFNQPGNPVRQHPGFSRTCPCKIRSGPLKWQTASCCSLFKPSSVPILLSFHPSDRNSHFPVFCPYIMHDAHLAARMSGHS